MNVCCRLKSDLSRHTKYKLIKRTFNLKNFSVKQSQRKLLAFDTTRQRLTNNNIHQYHIEMQEAVFHQIKQLIPKLSRHAHKGTITRGPFKQ